MSDSINLPDIPDLSGIGDEQEAAPFEDGWYKGQILAKREFTDKNGNTRVFESGDAPSQNGDSRNIRLQIQVTRQSDGRQLNVSQLVNYRPEDLTAATVSAIKAQQEKIKEGAVEDWGTLFRPFATLQRLQKLQAVGGVRQLQRDANTGGLDLTAVYGKEAYIRLRPDSRNPQYKEVADIRPVDKAPRKVL